MRTRTSIVWSTSWVVAFACCGAIAAAAAPTRPLAAGASAWEGYLDYAYVYSSAEPAALRERLDGYAREAGVPLRDYIREAFASKAARRNGNAETAVRRKSIAYLLQYLAHEDVAALDAAAASVASLGERLERRENRYWYHYILAHQALERGQTGAFSRQILDLWLNVVSELEGPYETYQTLSLGDSSSAGFVSALPFLYENVARIVLIRSQQLGVDRGLDPLAVVVRMLNRDRVGAHPDVVPAGASAHDYLERIVARLDGPESDGGSLTFTLALFEASKRHDAARALLASEGLSDAALEALRVSSGAYRKALARARTLQGQSAVYTRALRQLGELHAAKQRLGSDQELPMPFAIESAMEVYAELHRDRADDWTQHGFGLKDATDDGRDAYFAALHGLWQEIQEASLNAGDAYLSVGLAGNTNADAALSDAAGFYSRYLSFFRRFATPDSKDAVPDTAFFAAHRAARGIGDAILSDSKGSATPAQVERAAALYEISLALFPFDAPLWGSLAFALERAGREGEYLGVARPLANSVARSRAIDAWITREQVGSEPLEAIRRALADDLAIVYLGFSDPSGLAELEAKLEAQRGERSVLAANLDALRERHAALSRARTDALAQNQLEARGAPVAAPGALDAIAELPPVSAAAPVSAEALEISKLADDIFDLEQVAARLDEQIAARSGALPLFAAAVKDSGVSQALGAQRAHPLHGLLRRTYFEGNARARLEAAGEISNDASLLAPLQNWIGGTRS